MRLFGPISTDRLFEMLYPAGLVLAGLISVWVLRDARRRRFRLYAALAWALAALLYPPVVLPLYLIARSAGGTPREESPAPRRPWLLAALYALVLFLALGAYLYADYRSAEAHLARAADARLLNQRERAIRELRAALAREDDPHTRKLLGVELAEAGHAAEALDALLAAERGGEPDELLHFRIACALEALGRAPEAITYYEEFLRAPACAQALPDRHCPVARERAQRLSAGAP